MFQTHSNAAGLDYYTEQAPQPAGQLCLCWGFLKDPEEAVDSLYELAGLDTLALMLCV